MSELIECCAECHEPTTTLKTGDEGFTFCENCQMVEGDVIYLTEEEVDSRD